MEMPETETTVPKRQVWNAGRAVGLSGLRLRMRRAAVRSTVSASAPKAEGRRSFVGRLTKRPASALTFLCSRSGTRQTFSMSSLPRITLTLPTLGILILHS